MTQHRRLLGTVAVLALVLLLGTVTTRPGSARTVDDRCAGRARLPASALADGLSSPGCSLVGRVVYAGPVTVVVPPPGVSVAGDGLRTDGEVVGLRVTNTGTTVRATTSAPARATGVAVTVGSRADDPSACRDRTFNLEHHRWVSSLRYRINVVKAPERFAKRTVVRQIRIANGNVRKGRTTCGKARLGTPASHYLGRTTTRPNIRPGSTTIGCGAYNTRNVVGFGDLPGRLLGWTCYWWLNNGRMAAADILLDNGSRLATHLPATCTDTYDLEGTVTHEFGHVYGLAHTGAGHANLTMDQSERACSTYARTLGLGDWLGMKKMYGLR
jgi:hypothetical protein